MKHTLFLTMMAAALLGGQVFAGPAVYSVDTDWSDGEPVFILGEATVLVDAQKTLDSFNAVDAQSLTLNYQDNFVLTASERIDTPDSGVLNITTTVDSVATAWEKAFSIKGGGSITLCHSDFIDSNYGPVQFFGKDKDSTVKLGDSEVKFMGLVDALSDLAMNQVGVAWTDTDLTLVGKLEAPAPVPEPTTGSLSLLALAGLCARRRK